MPEDTRTRCFGSPEDPLMMSYHDNEWGVPVHDDRKQFEFLCLERHAVRPRSPGRPSSTSERTSAKPSPASTP